jgi:ribonuclease Z
MKKTIFLLMMSVIFFSLISCEKILEMAAKNQMNETRSDMLTDGNLHVVLVGSGGPFPNTERVSVSTAMIADGEFILVDTGPGTARNTMLQNLPIGDLSAVFLTHFHSDHIGDLGEVNMFSWIQGNRKKRLEVFGPEGVEKVVKGYALSAPKCNVFARKPEISRCR